MKTLLGIAAFALRNFGPLIVFFAVNKKWGLLAAIGASVAVAVLEVLWTLARKRKTSRLFWMSATLTVAFGLVDLYLQKSVLFRFEAVISNVLVGGYFGASLFGGRSLLEDFYESGRASGKVKEEAPPEVPQYLRIFTVVWTIYFFAKAALYLWIGLVFPLERAVALRSIIGTVSFVVLIGGEQLVRKPLFRFMKGRGWLVAKAKPDAALEAAPIAET